ncbi:MAG: GNAT family N-acetyltransferase [Flammeovirgaceae bacterium]
MSNISNYYQGFESERLLYRSLSLDDAESWQHFFEDHDSLAYFELPSIEKDKLFMAKRWIRKQLTRYEQQHFGQLAMVRKEDGVLIGLAGFKYMEYKGTRYPEMMCVIKKSYRRQGYSTEATIRFVRFAFDEQLTEKVLFTIHEKNVGSQRTLESLGFQKIDILTMPQRNVYIYEAVPTMIT